MGWLGSRDDLEVYSQTFLKVLDASAGDECIAGATVFQPAGMGRPLRITAIHLDVPPPLAGIRTHSLGGSSLHGQLKALGELIGAGNGHLPRRSVATVYDVPVIDGCRVATAYLIKPNQARFWTRAAALRDADAMVAAGMLWRDTSPFTRSPTLAA